MASEKIPLELENITKYVRYAEELTQNETSPESRLVAYYCRQYAIQLGTPLATGPDGEAALATIVDAIDTDKDEIEKFTKEEAYTTCRSHAMGVFNKADAEDRAGETGNETAENFDMAGHFLDVLKQFTVEGGRGEEAVTEEEKKSVYAKQRAASISNTIKEGGDLTPGGYDDDGADDDKGEEEELDSLQQNGMPLPSMREDGGEGSDTPPTRVGRQRSVHRSDRSLGHAATFDRPPTIHPSIQSVNSMPGNTRSPKSKKTPAFGKVFRASPPISPTDGNPANSEVISKQVMKDARELAKFAVKALDMKDVDVAVKRLKEALETLGH